MALKIKSEKNLSDKRILKFDIRFNKFSYWQLCVCLAEKNHVLLNWFVYFWFICFYIISIYFSISGRLLPLMNIWCAIKVTKFQTTLKVGLNYLNEHKSYDYLSQKSEMSERPAAKVYRETRKQQPHFDLALRKFKLILLINKPYFPF